ncbi:hypothetical protein [Chryseobacterium sp. R2A-55]|uniref:hypothetical protein n=1 Tax=Chryseobacterium sp. R2A-55 TaxID=2744445 RepID=UPI001F30AEAB|nr:hypothetical protein [Chryseobacterium sp. R2A-55]
MNTLKIEIPAGFKVESFDEKSGTVKFAPLPKDVTERIKSIDDAVEELGENDLEVIELRKLQKAEITSHILKNQMAVVIIKALNEGWVPDWTNSSQYKYFPWFKMCSSSGVGFSCTVCDGWNTLSLVGSRLALKNSGLAKYAGTQFTSIFKDFMTI